MACALMITHYRNEGRFVRTYYNFVGTQLTKTVCAKVYIIRHNDLYDIEDPRDVARVVSDLEHLQLNVDTQQAVLVDENDDEVDMLFMII